MTYKISSIIIGIILVSLFTGVLGIWFGSLYDAYTPTDYDNTSYGSYNKLDDISSNVESVQNETLSISQPTGVLDVIGSLFASGYRAVLLTVSTTDLMSSMTNDAIDQADIGESSNLFKTAITLILAVIFIVGIILAVVLRRESGL